MRCVVFDPEDLEALTVIEVPQMFIRELEQGRRDQLLRFPIPASINFSWPPPEPTIRDTSQYAEVMMERFQRNGVWTWCAIALNPEICLLMKSALLPGQRRDAQQREREAFLSGLMAAFLG